jgi:hypothetical protein
MGVMTGSEVRLSSVGVVASGNHPGGPTEEGSRPQMKLVQLSPDDVVHVQPKYTGRTLCGETRGWAAHITDAGAPTCELCRESLDDLIHTLVTA